MTNEEETKMLTNKNLKVIMNISWKMAKEAAVKFGGKAVEYLSESMKIAWAMYKEQMAKFKAEYEIKQNSVKVSPSFVNSKWNMKMFYNANCNKVIRETEKAVLLDLEPLNPGENNIVWVPKSCLL